MNLFEITEEILTQAPKEEASRWAVFIQWIYKTPLHFLQDAFSQ